jgi:hypothetical protein
MARHACCASSGLPYRIPFELVPPETWFARERVGVCVGGGSRGIFQRNVCSTIAVPAVNTGAVIIHIADLAKSLDCLLLHLQLLYTGMLLAPRGMHCNVIVVLHA